MKKCKCCNEEKPLDQFYKRQAKCKPCHIEYVKQYRKNNPEKEKQWNENEITGISLVYLLPDHNYVGVTNRFNRRMSDHRSTQGRNTDNVRVLYTTKSRDEALELEALLHDMGYEGRNENYTRRNY